MRPDIEEYTGESGDTAFNCWLTEVNAQCMEVAEGLTLFDFPDEAWRAWFDSGVEPKNAFADFAVAHLGARSE